ncbi:hypothetical protein GCK72_020472 [Caenorhabditis remanei]|uniref:F-box domain-containing protein n=1 Tax=Caenorhabditis remanei TaxID=31234 RepID=A0A6A5GH68_CAERE|nr:hypothetical protein GCK72_020472 [Caenorhabditis remanei]KAF1753915.1 hypothetical protein GCK72_020472 [Caenorhabditis remanei]
MDQLHTVPMNEILDLVGFPAILTLRKVSSNLRDFIDDTCPDFNLKSVDVTLESKKISVNWILASGNFLVCYSPHENGFMVSCENKEKIVENSHYIDAFYNDFSIVLKNQKTPLERFHLCLSRFTEQLNFLEFFKKKSWKIKTKYFDMGFHNSEAINHVLPCLDSEVLKEIRFFNTTYKNQELNLDQVVNLEQFNDAKRFSVRNFSISTAMLHFCHFTTVNAMFSEITAEDMDLLKFSAITSPKFEKFNIEYEMFKEDDKLVELLGSPYYPPNSTGRNKKQWFFKTTHQTDKVLQIVHHICFNRFDFLLMDKSSVPSRASVRKLSRYDVICTLL